MNLTPGSCEPVAPGMGVAPSQLYENRKPEWLEVCMLIVCV